MDIAEYLETLATRKGQGRGGPSSCLDTKRQIVAVGGV